MGGWPIRHLGSAYVWLCALDFFSRRCRPTLVLWLQSRFPAFVGKGEQDEQTSVFVQEGVETESALGCSKAGIALEFKQVAYRVV